MTDFSVRGCRGGVWGGPPRAEVRVVAFSAVRGLSRAAWSCAFVFFFLRRRKGHQLGIVGKLERKNVLKHM